MILRAILLALVLGLATPASADPEEIEFCEHAATSCPSLHYAFFKNARCEKTCQSNYQPPSTPEVWCISQGRGSRCEVWPRGPDLSYTYGGSATVSLSDPGPTDYPQVFAECRQEMRPATVWVTVTSPYGYSASTSVSIPCRPQLVP